MAFYYPRMKLMLIPIWFFSSLLLLFISALSLSRIGKKEILGVSSNINFTNNHLSSVSDNNLRIPPKGDIRIETLRAFLKENNSPLYEFAEEIVKQADIYGIEYALIPAIAFQESNGCKIIPQDSHNCWGLGIYGDKVLRFSSYPEAIEKVARTIKEAYIKKGLTNATLVEDRWTPSSRGNWSYGVNYFIGKIKEFEKKYPAS